MEKINLWLDDIRTPPDGWVWVKTVEQAKELLLKNVVRRASLDHDLGSCDDCIRSFLGRLPKTLEETQQLWLEKTKFSAMPNCPHAETGYTLVCWMEEFGHWPVEKPNVHSANPVGRDKMLAAINREWSRW